MEKQTEELIAILDWYIINAPVHEMSPTGLQIPTSKTNLVNSLGVALEALIDARVKARLQEIFSDDRK